LGEAKGLPDGQAVPRDIVSKWIRGDLYPGIDNIYYLAQVFGVTMEYILMAGSEYEKFDDRPFSLYAVAKSGDKERLEQLMHTENDYGGIIGENYDEFDKTILDYLIEFKQVELIKYMFEKGYLSIWGTQMSTAIRVGNLTGMEDKFNEFVDLALEYDDVELFQYLIKPTRPILQKKEDCELEAFQETQFRRDGYVFSKQMIEKLLKTENILNSYLRSFTLTKEEWEEWNGGIVYHKSNKGREICEELEHVPTVSASFNLLLNYLLLKGHRLSEKMLNFAIEHKKQAQLYPLIDELYENLVKKGNRV
jgi:transcriptional regulator with XRE-family HTH domain